MDSHGTPPAPPYPVPTSAPALLLVGGASPMPVFGSAVNGGGLGVKGVKGVSLWVEGIWWIFGLAASFYGRGKLGGGA